MVPKKRPSSIGRTQVSICSSVPYSTNRLAFAIVRKGYDDVDALADWNHAMAARVTTVGSCMPPTSSSNWAAMKPALLNSSSAAPTSSIISTLPSAPIVGSFWSAFLLCGANRLMAMSSLRSRMLSNVSRECSE